VARYENDHYQQQSDQVPGNPWFICTLWLAEWLIAKACTEDDVAEALPLLEWVAQRALPSGVLAEQVHPFTGAPLSVSPLTWSHATFVATVVEYLDKKAELSTDPQSGTPLYFRERRSIRTQHQHHATIKKIGVASPPRPEDPTT
jgi:GH15 family glucan-1,4-alpha-glucosidase